MTDAQTPAKKSMGPKRKGAKQYALVTFEFDLFEGEFTLPKIDTLPLGILAALDDGDLSKFLKFLKKYAPDSVEAVAELSPDDELQDFMAAWSKASGAETPKSSS